MGSGEAASMENIDRSLIDAHCKGDATAFGEIVRRYGDSVLGYLTRMAGNREQAEDLFQETFKRVHEKAHTFRGGQFKSWLFKIATRVTIDHARRRGRLKIVSLNQRLDCNNHNSDEPEAVAVVDWRNPSQEAVKIEQIEQVQQAIQSLPDKQRATLVLAYYQQLSYPEVAEVLGCSVGTVKTQMYRALRTLAKRLPDISEG
jgi:RNA polymerase sigma-70 factor (ECF subfamily)